MECVILIGAQASGKSSFYRDRFFRSHMRINLDMLRTRRREWHFVQVCLASGQAFVVDNTNPQRCDRARYIDPARRAGFSVTGYWFDAPLADLLRRNAQRSEHERIPERGVRGTRARIEPPLTAEGFDALYRVVTGTDGLEVAPLADDS